MLRLGAGSKSLYSKYTLLLLLAFNNPRGLRARGGAGYTFGALTILVRQPTENPGVCRFPEARQSPPVPFPPGQTAVIHELPSRGGSAVC